MVSRARLAAVLMAVVMFVLSGEDSSRTNSAARTAIPEPSAMAHELQSRSFSIPIRDKSSPSREVSEEQMLAWILLLLKQGAGAR
jgi:hypothetical protein